MTFRVSGRVLWSRKTLEESFCGQRGASRWRGPSCCPALPSEGLDGSPFLILPSVHVPTDLGRHQVLHPKREVVGLPMPGLPQDRPVRGLTCRWTLPVRMGALQSHPLLNAQCQIKKGLKTV